MSEPAQTLTSSAMVTGKLHLVRKGHTKRFAETPPVAFEPVRKPARLAIMLALAHKIQHAIDRDVVIDCAEVARRLGSPESSTTSARATRAGSSIRCRQHRRRFASRHG
jgi:hypothetical protein